MIVGTAGHVDHGKTALVGALTGTDTDRLAEEKARGISIEPGYAYLKLPSGEVLGFVDVPGHERFMRQMVAGASGIDLALLCVAADDGVMPQTREHLAVIELLGIARGAIVLTRCDLAGAARMAEVESQVSRLVQGTIFEDCPIHRTAAVRGDGIAELRAALDAAAARPPAARDEGALRFAIDRAFTLAGAGTVVTGVVASGRIAVGDTVCISPLGHEARVRALHVQNREGKAGERGQRCGVNLGRVELADVARGDFLLAPDLHAPAERIDADLVLLKEAPRALRQWQSVRLHYAAREVPARVALLSDTPIAPGQQGRVQLVPESPIAAAVGERFVLRDSEGRRTIGGGRMIDLRAPQRRRRQPRRLEQLDAMALADPAASLAAQLAIWPWYVVRERFVRDRALDEDTAARVLAGVPHQAERGPDGPTYLFGEAVWKTLRCSARGEVCLFHKRFPQLLGPNFQRLRLALGPRLAPEPAAAAFALMVRRGVLAHEGGVYRLPEHQLGLDRDDEVLWRHIVPLLSGEARFRPPRGMQIAEVLGARDFDCRRVLKAMAKRGDIVEIAPDHFFLRDTLNEIAAIVARLAETADGGQFGAAQLRDRLNNGRKVAIQLLEWFDRQGVTLRRGDLRTIDPRKLAGFRDKVAASA